MINVLKSKMQSQMGRDVIWTFMVQMLIMLCGFAINKILSNRLTIDDFGLFNVIKRSSTVLSFVMLAGTGIAIPRYLAIFRNKQLPFSSISFNQASLCFVITIAILLSAIFLCMPNTLGSFLTGTNQIHLLLVALLYAFCMALASFLYAYFRGTNQFNQFNLSQTVIQCSCVIILLLLPTLTVLNVYVAWIVIFLIGVLAFTYYETNRFRFISLRRHNPPSIRQQLKEVAGYATPRMIGDFFLFSLAAFPVIYLSKYYHLQDVAYFSVGLTFVSLGTSLFSFLGYILLPYVSGALARHEMQLASRAINKLLWIYLAASAGLTLVFYLFTPFMIQLFFSSSYLVSTDLTRILLLAILPQSVYLLYRNPIDAVSKTPYNTIILGICLLVMIVSFFLTDSLPLFAIVYLGVSFLQGLLSLITWMIIKK